MDCAATVEEMHTETFVSNEPVSIVDSDNVVHPLNDTWVLWAHLPHNTDWSIKSYTNIAELNNMEEVIALNESVNDNMIKNCMLFLMRKGINPMWEDKKNINGGSFSFKILNKDVCSIWRNLLYLVCGESISNDDEFLECVNGITISPKKSFCIVKIWMSNINFQSTSKLNKINGLSMHGCIFKKHK